MSSSKIESSHPIEDLSSDDENSLLCIECEICSVEFSNVKAYEQHLNGKKHHKMLKKIKIMSRVAEAKDGNEHSVSEDEGKEDIRCEVCSKSFSGHVPYYAHLKSQIHLKNVTKNNLKDKLADVEGVLNKGDNDNFSDDDDGILPSIFAQCKTCKKVFYGPESYYQHLQSVVHKKKKKQKVMAEALNVQNSNDLSENDECTLTCETCNKSFSGLNPYATHMKSTVHQKELKKVELVAKLKEFCKVTDDKTFLICKQCDKKFSDPFALKVHLSSKDHEKQEFRKQIKDFLSSHQEIMMAKAIENKDSDEEHDEFFVCKTCHISVSGPENAKSHVLSKKHISMQKQLKALKEMKQKKIEASIKCNGKKENDNLSEIVSDKNIPTADEPSVVDLKNNSTVDTGDFELI